MVDDSEPIEGRFTSFESAAERKHALRTARHIRAVYEIKTHSEEIVPEDDLEVSHAILKELAGVNLIAHIPSRGYRITSLGRAELEAAIGPEEDE